MRIALIADARSEHTRRWVAFLSQKDDVMLLSTHPFSGEMPGVKIVRLPKIFSAGNAITRSTVTSKGQKGILARFISHSLLKAPRIWHLWQRVNVIDVLLQGKVARKAVQSFQPNVIHAMRIQNEGYVGALTRWHPFIISAMGHDFVYTAKRSAMHRHLTRKTLPRCDGFMADCQRDLRLASEFGLKQSVPRGFFPGNGGVDLQIFRPGLDQKERMPHILYFRGISPHFRPITLMRAMRSLIAKPKCAHLVLHVLAPATSLAWFEGEGAKLGLMETNFRVSPFVSPKELAQLLQTTAIAASPTISDGTPNSLLEAMACGAFPVASNLESIREWITPENNGLLFDPDNADELAACLEHALENIALRQQAQAVNYTIIRARADYHRVMPEVRRFYQQLVHQ
jgi:glycosyltransferase involved in cell wall biosynthesis